MVEVVQNILTLLIFSEKMYLMIPLCRKDYQRKFIKKLKQTIR